MASTRKFFLGRIRTSGVTALVQSAEGAGNKGVRERKGVREQQREGGNARA